MLSKLIFVFPKGKKKKTKQRKKKEIKQLIFFLKSLMKKCIHLIKLNFWVKNTIHFTIHTEFKHHLSKPLFLLSHHCRMSVTLKMDVATFLRFKKFRSQYSALLKNSTCILSVTVFALIVHYCDSVWVEYYMSVYMLAPSNYYSTQQ